MRCTCGSQNFDEQNYCQNCGTQLQGESMVPPTQSQGNRPFVVPAHPSKSAMNLMNIDSNEVSIYRAQKLVQNMASAMKLPQYYADAAIRIYRLAKSWRNFIQGRSTTYVLAASLYIVCRQEKAPFMLIDFADKLSIDLNSLGSTFLKLVEVLKQEKQIPAIDPSLYIHKFCNNLNLGDKTNEVAMTALRLVKRMKRDWLSYGRRPSGLCGAAILIASRYHGFHPSTQKILQTVKVCNDTIRKRLDEFQNTPVASLTLYEFQTIDLESEELPEADPPAFREPKPTKIMAIEKFNSPLPIRMETDTLSDVDDDEINQFILTPEESELKSIIWHQLNAEWVKKQEIREMKKEQKAKKIVKKQQNSPPTTPAEAIANSNKFSAKSRLKVEQVFAKVEKMNVEQLARLTKNLELTNYVYNHLQYIQ